MISLSFPSKRKVLATVFTPQKWYSPAAHAGALARKISTEEFQRRDDLIFQLYKDCPYAVGDIVYPSTKKGYTDFGPCKVVGICKRLLDFSPDSKWPASDNPMIVTFYSVEDPSKHHVCTSNYMITKNTHLVC
jgi:hypothetical protein